MRCARRHGRRLSDPFVSRARRCCSTDLRNPHSQPLEGCHRCRPHKRSEVIHGDSEFPILVRFLQHFTEFQLRVLIGNTAALLPDARRESLISDPNCLSGFHRHVEVEEP